MVRNTKSTYKWDPLGPVVVGGVGGSGTRVVAEILIDLGFYLGQCYPERLDNEWFTRLSFLPRKCILSKFRGFPKQEEKVLKLFGSLMTSAQFPFLRRVLTRIRFLFNFIFIWNFENIVTRLFPIKYLLGVYFRDTIFPPKGIEKMIAWGWKEPASYLYIECLSRRFKRMKYIHVMRHGLDMAFSSNTDQFKLWYPLVVGAPVPESLLLIPEAKLRYWILANQKALDVAEKNLPGRYFILRYEDLCLRPAETILRLTRFLGVEVSGERILDLCGSVKPPDSINRYQNEDGSIFTDEMIRQVADLGYAYEKN